MNQSGTDSGFIQSSRFSLVFLPIKFTPKKNSEKMWGLRTSQNMKHKARKEKEGIFFPPRSFAFLRWSFKKIKTVECRKWCVGVYLVVGSWKCLYCRKWRHQFTIYTGIQRIVYWISNIFQFVKIFKVSHTLLNVPTGSSQLLWQHCVIGSGKTQLEERKRSNYCRHLPSWPTGRSFCLLILTKGWWQHWIRDITIIVELERCGGLTPSIQPTTGASLKISNRLPRTESEKVVTVMQKMSNHCKGLYLCLHQRRQLLCMFWNQH